MVSSIPLVSVVIPVYNHEKYVKQALKSVVDQTYPNVEMVIIDDGSKDKSALEIETFIQSLPIDKQKNIQFIKQTNQGAHQTINKGLSLAKGDYLTILNSDDYFANSRIKKLVEAIQKQNSDWGFTEVTGINPHNQNLPLDHYWKLWYEHNLFNSSLQPTIGFQLLRDNITVSTGNLIFSRSLYTKIGGFNDYKLAHDYDFALRALLISEPVFIREKLYFYRMHDSNTLHEVNHLAETEKKAIYLNYILQISKNPPENPSAPCHWYWPILFPKYRTEYHLDRGLLGYLDPKAKTQSKEEETLEDFSQIENSLDLKKKITLITHSLCLSGAPKVVLDLARLLKQNHCELNLISLADGPVRKEFEDLGIPVHVIPQKLRFWHLEPSRLKKAVALFKLLKQTYFKAHKQVIGNCAVCWPILFPLAYFKKKSSFFWYIHDSFSPSVMIGPGAGMRMFNKLKNANHFKAWFGSKSTQEIWSEGIEGSVKYWSGLTKKASESKKTKKIKNLLFVGSVTPRKAPHSLINAFIDCVQNKSIPEDVTLTIIGFEDVPGDSYLYELLLKKNQESLANRLHFVKSLSAKELPSFFKNADLYIQPSVVECLPLSLLQAMSYGLPIITTDANGCIEAIEDNVNGYVCAVRNSKELSETLEKAINNPEKSFHLGQKALQTFNEKFSIENTWKEISKEL
jgi:glycosyltransferase involved in cell wall biosynthesis